MKSQRNAKSLLVLLLFLCSAFRLSAQEKDVSGRVTDAETKDPLTGVTVSVKGTNRSVLTNADGMFTLKVPNADAVLVFSYVGFLEFETKAGDQAAVAVSMTKSNSQMEEVVFVGYGTQKRPNVLGSVATIRPRDIEDLPVANLSTALQNRVPGVSIGQTSGRPGSSTTLRIRNPVTFGGTGASVDPLYVIDGVAFDAAEGKDVFDNLDATMIESISFLKDAAASIYGSRGANGVVLIVTKRGKPGKPKISYTGSLGISTEAYMPEMLSSYDHAVLLNNKYLNRGASYHTNGAGSISHLYTQTELDYLKTHNYNWVDEVWDDSYLQRHTINVSGGSDKITYFAGANYYNETGNLKDLYTKVYGLRLGATAKITERITANISLSTDQNQDNRPSPEGLSGITDQADQMNGVMTGLLLTPRWIPMYIDGKPVYAANGNWHPLEFFNTNSYKRSKSTGMYLNASLEYKLPFIEGLTFRVQYGRNQRTGTGKEYNVPYTLYNFVREGIHGNYNSITSQNVKYTTALTTSPTTVVTNDNRLLMSSSTSLQYQLNEILTYSRKFGDHDLTVMAVAEQSESEGESFRTLADRQVIPGVDELWGFSLDKANFDHLSSRFETGRASYLGRLNYSFKDRYLLEGVIRADASPNFPPSSRWGYFPSVAVGWKVSEEKFFSENVRFFNALKIRFQVGLTGSDAVANYQYYERYTQTTGMLFGSSMSNGLNPNVLPNPNITWEKALYKNLGIDGTILNRRFDFSIDLWHRYSYDMLQSSTTSVPSTLGGNISSQNYGKLKSFGIDASLGYNGNVGKDFKFNVDVIFTLSDNKVVQKYYNAGADTGWKYPIGRRTDNGIEGYLSTGIVRTQEEVDNWYKDNPGWLINGDSLRTGYLNFVDINKDGIINSLDKTRIAARSGSLFGMGFNLGAGWKGFKLSASISLSVGGTRAYDRTARTPPNESTNALSIWKDSWGPSNPNGAYPIISAPLLTEESNFWMRSGTTMRVNNMQLSYAIPARLMAKWKLPDVRAFVAGTNLWTIINNQPYKDPATNVAIDYPILRTFTFGLNVSL